MVKRSTWIWLILFLVALGFYFLIKYIPSSTEVEPTPTVTSTRYLFDQTDGALLRLRVVDDKYNVVELERPSGGFWNVILPIPGLADQARAEAAASQSVALRIVGTIESSQPLSSLGLDTPGHVIKITFEDKIEHKLEIGAETPTGSGYYVRLDRKNIYIISPDGIDALLNLLVSPPYLQPTSTLAPSFDPVITPELPTPTP